MARTLSRVGNFFILFSQLSLDGRLWPACSVVFEFLFPSSQPSSDGELWLARSAVLDFIYLVHSPSCPQMASSSLRTLTHLFFLYYYSSPPAIDRQRASACMHSHVGSFFYILHLRQLSIDGECLSFGSSHAQLHCFFFLLFFIYTSCLRMAGFSLRAQPHWFFFSFILSQSPEWVATGGNSRSPS